VTVSFSGRTLIRRFDFVNLLLFKLFHGNQVQVIITGWACISYERNKESIQDFGGETCCKPATWKTGTKMEV
jgi:hypothetical protein